MTSEIIEAEHQLVTVEPSPPALFGTTEPTEIIAKARDVANALKDVIKQQGLISNIQGKEYVRCEGWTLLGSMLGVFPVTTWTREVEGGWEARVEAKTLSGATVGAAEAQCTRAENTWKSRDPYALRSMAQTRATSKAMRMPLGFVITLAGFEVTPAEEMDFSASKKPNVIPPDLPVPLCPTHQQECNFVRAGKAKNGKPYPAFYVCPEKDCTAGWQGRNWSVKLQEWVDQQTQLAQLMSPADEPVDAHDLPNE